MFKAVVGKIYAQFECLTEAVFEKLYLTPKIVSLFKIRTNKMKKEQSL